MRRSLRYILILLGLFLIVLSPLIRFYSFPHVLKAPLDPNDTSRSVGPGIYFAIGQLKDVSAQLENVATTRGVVKLGTPDRAVYDQFSATKNVGTNYEISVGTERFVIDRVSGAPIHCCGEHPRHQGITVKFPFYVKKQTYLFWDSTAKAAFPAKYSGTGTLEGLKVYIFRQHVPPTQIGSVQVSGTFGGDPSQARVNAPIYYTADTTLWVEPFTGGILKGGQHAVQELRNVATGQRLILLADTNLVNTPQTVANTASQITTKYGQLKLVQWWLPIFGPVIGLIIILIGALIRDRQRPSQRAVGTQTAAQQPA